MWNYLKASRRFWFGIGLLVASLGLADMAVVELNVAKRLAQ